MVDLYAVDGTATKKLKKTIKDETKATIRVIPFDETLKIFPV